MAQGTDTDVMEEGQEQERLTGRLIAHLREAGEVVTPGDEGYDEGRTPYFVSLRRSPTAIVRPADAHGVARVIGVAQDAGIPLAVRGRGHSPAGFGGIDGGVVLDLSRLNGLALDVPGRSAWVGGGATAGAYTRQVGPHGLATGFGDAGAVGVAGITLAGGMGFLHRKLGLTLDSLLAAEVVTAAGQAVITDETTHPDLFWALRGGGGNFGVVTRLQLRLHEVRTVTSGMFILPATPAVVAGALQAALEAPDDLSGMVNVAIAPPMPFIPAELHGSPIVMAAFVHAGTEEAAQRDLAPFRALATPLMDQFERMPYGAIYDGPHPPPRNAIVIRPHFQDSVTSDDAGAILDALQRSTAPMRMAQFRVLGGAVARVAPEATAFAHRSRPLFFFAAAMFDDAAEAEEHGAWADGLVDAVRRGPAGAYSGFLDPAGNSRVRDTYPSGTWKRLQTVKRRWDPDNLFRSNHNVVPGGSGEWAGPTQG